jgi:glutamate/tyrosine decarboxylase-like PLP-dependent enzyme
MQQVAERAEYFIGYPIAVDFDYSNLYPLLKYPLNNIGDPFIESIYDLNSRSFEKEVISFFAELFCASLDNGWGYVTNGGSEGNLYGLYVARELYPQGMVYYSEATHYSVQKNIHLLNMPCGVVIVKKNYKDRIGKNIPYIGTLDITIPGSRNDHSPVFLWYIIKKMGREGLTQRAINSLQLAEYTVQQLSSIGIKAWRNKNAFTVVFPTPPEKIYIKW